MMKVNATVVSKTFGSLRAVKELSLVVEAGEEK
jgi:ABC-type uncharacterized transport system ATPase subunit